MATGNVWIRVYQTSGPYSTSNWVTGTPYIRVDSGWKRVASIRQKTDATTWTLRYSSDVTPPGKPVMSLPNSTTIRVAQPADADVLGIVLKRSTTGYPTGPSTIDGNFDQTIQSDGFYWSRWYASPSQYRDRPLPVSQTQAGQTVYFTAWSYDTSNNYSSPAYLTWKKPAPVTPPPTLVAKSADILPTDSASWMQGYGSWRTDNNYVYQGGSADGRGLWFYSNRIQAALAKAVNITKMQIYVQRLNNGTGVNGAANVKLAYSRLQNQPPGSPTNMVGTPLTVNAALTPGQGAWINIPSSYWNDYKSGYWAGFGLASGAGSYTDSNYTLAYGAGTSSGKVHIEWQEYA